MLWSFPAAFLLLGFFALLFLRRRKPKNAPVQSMASVALWKQLAIRHGRLTAGTSPWKQRHLWWWAAALLCFILAAAGPVRWIESTKNGAAVVILDNRLDAIPGTERLWAERKRAALSWLESARPGQARALLVTAPTPRIAHPFSGDAESLRASLLATTRSQSAAARTPEDALLLASTVWQNQSPGPPGTVVWISAFKAPASAASLPDLVALSPGDPDTRAFATMAGAALSRHPESPRILRWQAGARNLGTVPATVHLRVGGSPFPEELVILDLQPRETQWRTGEFNLSADTAAAVKFSLGQVEQNQLPPLVFALPVPPLPEYRAEIVGPPDSLFLQEALRSLPGWHVEVLSADDWEPRPGPDLRVLTGIPDEEKIRRALSQTPAWLFACGPFASTTTNPLPFVVWQNPHHPVMAGLDLETISIGKAWLPDSEKKWTPVVVESLVESPAGPLILAGGSPLPGEVPSANETNSHRWLALAFRPQTSNLPLRAAFPILVRQGTLWLLNRPTFATESRILFPLEDAGEMTAGSRNPAGVFSSAPWWNPLFIGLGLLCLLMPWWRISFHEK